MKYKLRTEIDRDLKKAQFKSAQRLFCGLAGFVLFLIIVFIAGWHLGEFLWNL